MDDTCACGRHTGVDDMQVQTMCRCGQCAGADDMCRRHADDVYVMLGVVLHEIGQLRQEEAKQS